MQNSVWASADGRVFWLVDIIMDGRAIRCIDNVDGHAFQHVNIMDGRAFQCVDSMDGHMFWHVDS